MLFFGIYTYTTFFRLDLNESPTQKYCVIKQVHLLGNLSRELDTVLCVCVRVCLACFFRVLSLSSVHADFEVRS